jgi:adenylate kinase
LVKVMGLNVVVMGPPGAGKGTQAERFARERNLPKISTGDILREAIKAQTPLGRRAKELVDAGKLVDDATVIGIVRERLLQPDAKAGFLLDGFPRTVAQAQELDRIVAECCAGALIVVDINVPEQELIRRLGERRVCKNCGTNADPFAADGAGCARCGGELVKRVDDNEQVVRNRLEVYHRDTKPLVDYYQDRSTFRVVNGAQPPERVAKDLAAAIDGVSGEPPQSVTARRGSTLESLL